MPNLTRFLISWCKSTNSKWEIVNFVSRLTSSPHESGEESPDSIEYRTSQKGGPSNVMGQKVLKRFKPPMTRVARFKHR